MRFALRPCAVSLALLACALYFAPPRPAAAQTQAGQVIISELRFRGPAGQRDEFVEIYNNTNSPVTVQASDASPGWAVSMSGNFNGTVVRGNVCLIPNGTVIPRRGHYLCANTDPDSKAGYSLGNYPSGNPASPSSPTFATAQPDSALIVDDMLDGFGVALFSTQSVPNQTSTTRLDAFGFTSSPALYREGAGFPTVPNASTEHTLYRDLRTGLPKDTNNNAADFRFVQTTGTLQTQLNGSPGPENLGSPTVTSKITAALLDPNAAAASQPNRVRSMTPETNAPNGTILIRRTYTNTTGAPVSRLRFRVIDITTRGTPASECGGGPCADVRALTSADQTVTLVNSTMVTVRGVRLEENPPLTPEGGGLNASLSADFITLASPLAAGASVNIQFKLGVVTTGTFRFFVNVEAQNSPVIILKPVRP